MGCMHAGLLGGWTYSKVSWKKEVSAGHVSSGYAGAYFSALGKMFYANASFIGGWNSIVASREIDYVDRSPKMHHAGNQMLTHLDTGVNIRFGHFLLRPFERFDYITQKENGYSESNAGEFGLHVNESRSIFLRNELGLQFSACTLWHGATWTLSPKASWVREMRIVGRDYTEELSGSHEFFTSRGYFPNRSLFSPGVVASVLTGRMSFSVSYTGEYTHGYNNNQFGGEARVAF